jgi:proteasome assembly chaperone 3
LFTDRVLVSVNQLGKIGSVLAANVDVSPANNKKTYNVEIMMGRRDDPLLEIYARQLIEKVRQGQWRQGQWRPRQPG